MGGSRCDAWQHAVADLLVLVLAAVGNEGAVPLAAICDSGNASCAI